MEASIEEIKYEQCVSNRKKPFNLKPDDYNLFAHEFRKEVNSTKIYRLHKVTVTTEGVIIKNKKVFHPSVTSAKQVEWYDWKYLLGNYLLKKSRKIDQLCVLGFNAWMEGYYHWMTETLPRLFITKKYFNNGIVLLPRVSHRLYNKHTAIKSIFKKGYEINYNNSFYLPSLEPLGIQNFEFIDFDEYLRANEIIMPTHTAVVGNYNDYLIKEIRQHYSEFFKSNKNLLSLGEKFYISREKANRRKVVNEDEVMAILEDYGFRKICLEDYSFGDQVRIAQQAKVIISIHGAGLTNTMFMKPNTYIIELKKREDNSNHCYFSLANAVDVNYLYQYCDSHVKDTVQNSDIIVDVSELVKNVLLIQKRLFALKA